MNSSDVYDKYKSAKRRFYEELGAIQKAYISSHYAFKEGDVVVFKNIYYRAPTLIAIDSVFFNNQGNLADENSYRNPRVVVSGHIVDDEGYDKTIFPDSTQTIGVMASANDIIEVTNLRPKGLRRS